MGKTDVENALSQLDMLTKEEGLMVLARNLEVTHHIDGVVHDIDDNVKGVASSVDNGTHSFLSFVMQFTESLSLCLDIVAHELKSLSPPITPILTINNDTRLQGTRCRRNFDRGSLLQTHPLTITLHAKPNTVGQQRGLSEAAHSRIGRRMAPCYGSAEIVRLSGPFYISGN